MASKSTVVAPRNSGSRDTAHRYVISDVTSTAGNKNKIK